MKKLTGLMDGVLKVAEDIGVEVKVQGQKLEVAKENVEEAKDNVDKGNQQLEQAKDKGWKNNKYLQGALIGVGAFVIILIFIMIIRR